MIISHNNNHNQMIEEKIVLPSQAWTSTLPDHLSLAQLSIPGTHNSASFKTDAVFHKAISFTWQNQSTTIKQQLKMGIRFFDIRLKFNKDQSTKTCHDIICMEPFESVLRQFKEYLDKYETEFIIMMVGHEKSELKLCEAKERFVKDLKQSKICYLTKNGIPTVREVRGKVFIINTNLFYDTLSLHHIHPITIEHFHFLVQNRWEGPELEKKEDIKKVFLCQDYRKIRINFLTQSFGSNYLKREAFLSVLKCRPFDMRIKKMSQNYGEYFSDLMDEYPVHSTGIVLMDFVQTKWVEKIIQRNQFIK